MNGRMLIELFIIAIFYNILNPLKKGHAPKYILDHLSTSDYYEQQVIQHHRNYHNHYAQFNVQMHQISLKLSLSYYLYLYDYFLFFVYIFTFILKYPRWI